YACHPSYKADPAAGRGQYRPVAQESIGWLCHQSAVHGSGLPVFSQFMGSVEEFVALPNTVTWDGWLESRPMPIDFMLMMLSIYHCHQEQLAINEQMRNRERLFREHCQVDKLTSQGGCQLPAGTAANGVG